MKKKIKNIFVFLNLNTEKFILFSSIIISIVGFAYYFHEGLITAFGDSQGHLDIARRVFDSPTPGFAQLGGYWLPLLQLLMLPTVWINFFWQTGISGSIVNMTAYVITILYTYKLSLSITKNKASGIIAAFIVMLNPNLIYIQTAPMTEALFISCLVPAVYYFYRWLDDKKLQNAILAGLFILLMSINRYEGWGVAAVSSTLLVYEWLKTKFSRKLESSIIIYSVLAWYGIVLWLLWGLVLFHDPLEFIHNPTSAANQTKLQFATVKATGDHNFPLAIYTNILSVMHTSGIVILLLATLGIIYYIIKNFKSLPSIKILSLFLLVVPFLFDILTVYTGTVPVEVAELSKVAPPGNIFNIRYSLYLLPALAIFISMINRPKSIMIFIAALCLINYSILAFDNGGTLYILRDSGTVLSSFPRVKQDVSWFRNNYDGGMIICSAGGNDAYMHQVGINLKNYIVEGSYKIWGSALNNPSQYATWVIISKNNQMDLAYKDINKKQLFSDFSVVYNDNGFMILKNKKTNNTRQLSYE